MTNTHLTAVGLFLWQGFSQGKRVEKFCKHLWGSFANKRNANSLAEPYAHRKESEPSASRKPHGQVCEDTFVYKKKRTVLHTLGSDSMPLALQGFNQQLREKWSNPIPKVFKYQRYTRINIDNKKTQIRFDTDMSRQEMFQSERTLFCEARW